MENNYILEAECQMWRECPGYKNWWVKAWTRLFSGGGKKGRWMDEDIVLLAEQVLKENPSDP